MQNPLFLDPSISLEKVASNAHLEDEPERWPIEILKLAYQQVPSLRSYEADIELDRVDGPRGYAVGKVVIYPTQMNKEAAAGENRLVVLPVVVRDRELSPLDVYSHRGKMWPLDEEEIQQLLFNASAFERVADKSQFPGGTEIDSQIQPPTVDHGYNGGAMWKQASEGFATEDVDAFRQRLHEETGLRLSYLGIEALQPYTRDLLGFKEKTASERFAGQLENIKPTSIQFVEKGKGYLVKTASHLCFAPQERQVTRFEAQKLLNEKSWERLATDGYLTLSPEPLQTEQAVEKVAQEADRFGIYRVWSGGKAYEGFVVPHSLTLDGTNLQAQMFLGEDRHAMQEKIAGIFERDITVIPGPPRGKGVFLYQEGPMAVAYEPVEIKNMSKVASTSQPGVEDVTYYGRRLATGEDITIQVVPGLKKVAQFGDRLYAIPATFGWLSLEGKQVKVSDSKDVAHVFEHQKTAGSDSVVLHKSDDGQFWFEGDNSNILRGESGQSPWAEFNLCLLGVTGKQARELTKVASRHGKVRIPQTRFITPENDIKGQMVKKAHVVYQAARELPKIDLFREAAILTGKKAQELWKQASVVLSRETLDAILSLNFVTPENVSVYVSYLPELEKVSSILAELLVASRIGMDEVRESAAKNAMTQVHAVIRGLEQIQEKIQ